MADHGTPARLSSLKSKFALCDPPNIFYPAPSAYLLLGGAANKVSTVGRKDLKASDGGADFNSARVLIGPGAKLTLRRLTWALL